MVKQIELTIENTTATATLLEEKAPKTCKAILSVLPITGTVLHSRWCGDVARVPAEELPIKLGLENQTIYPPPRTLVWNPGLVSIIKEIFIVYGQARFSGRMGPIPSNLFAEITDNFEEFAKKCSKLAVEGAKEITIKEK